MIILIFIHYHFLVFSRFGVILFHFVVLCMISHVITLISCLEVCLLVHIPELWNGLIYNLGEILGFDTLWFTNFIALLMLPSYVAVIQLTITFSSCFLNMIWYVLFCTHFVIGIHGLRTLVLKGNMEARLEKRTTAEDLWRTVFADNELGEWALSSLQSLRAYPRLESVVNYLQRLVKYSSIEVCILYCYSFFLMVTEFWFTHIACELINDSEWWISGYHRYHSRGKICWAW